MNIYYKDDADKLCCIFADTDDHVSAIEAVTEDLAATLKNRNSPILALIQGGKA